MTDATALDNTFTIQPIMLNPQARKWVTYQPSNVALSWAFGSLLSIMYGKTKEQIRKEFQYRKLRLSDIAHVSFYISTRPRWN